jgi:hypothetical protein
MLILRVTDKGLYLDIPGARPSRTPADIDISKCKLDVVLAHLRKSGISEYQIISMNKPKKPEIKKSDPPKSKMNTKDINKRFSKLEEMMGKLLEKNQANDDTKKEQITTKLNTLERLSNKILAKEFVGPDSSTNRHKDNEPEIEELDEKFIPGIDISNLKMKSGSKSTIKQDDMDLDDSVDLLSRIMGQED